MPAPVYSCWNGATGSITTGPVATQATGATSGTARTMLQIQTASTTSIRVIEWGYTFDTAPTNNVRVELIDTGTVAATGLTAHVAAGIAKVNVPSGAASTVSLGTGATGYSAGSSTEGTITTPRLLDYHYENGLYYVKYSPLGREWEVPAGNVLRVRATPTSAAAVNISVWVTWEE
ncbi:hypothetical protein ACQP1O_42760 (plasmid) [Nocardia sp. CA-151230]|uniref:hypothetical protein n=1 Tax=Nocardia sp. CA-151230 TaxID=3239982 RepID=UPI003D91A98F